MEFKNSWKPWERLPQAHFTVQDGMRRLKRRINRLNALRIIDRSISSSLDIKATTNILLDNVLSETEDRRGMFTQVTPTNFITFVYWGPEGLIIHKWI